MPQIPRLLVTGAAGRLGMQVVKLLCRNGYSVLATDIVDAPSAPCPFLQADLRSHQEAKRCLKGCNVLIHLGNHPGMDQHIPQLLFNENMAINQNMFQGAAETGVERIVFASTLQLIGSHIDQRTVKTKPGPLKYPLDGDTEPDPSNVYALSKTLSERMLRYYAERCGMDCVAIRYPRIHDNEASIYQTADQASSTLIREGFTGITFDDAASLILAILRSSLPGYRVYAPGTAHRCADLPFPNLLKKFYPELPPDLPDLIDNSRITKETGWTPQSYSKRQKPSP